MKKPLDDFNEKYELFLTKDIVFKNNSLVTRNTQLISPAHYFYYTKLVFDLVLNKSLDIERLTYKGTNYESFYSGMLFTNINDVLQKPSREIMFDHSYGLFQRELKSYEHTQLLKIDLSDFFDSIKIDRLLGILYKKFDQNKVRKMEEFFKSFNISTLPQFHYSIASSILSQEYLLEFDDEIKDYLSKKDIIMIRFVDDMYFFNYGENWVERDFHELLDRLNKILWKYNLNLNQNKIELFAENTFKYQTINDYSDLYISSEKKVEEKALHLLNGDFIKFVKLANNLYEESGYNIEAFSKIFKSIFSIENDDARKVLTNFIFSGKYKKLNPSEVKYIVGNHSFIFFLPDLLFTLYLNIYDRYEKIYGRDEITIRNVLYEIDSNNSSSFRYTYASLHYLIQRGFKRKRYLNTIKDYSPKLDYFIKKYII